VSNSHMSLHLKNYIPPKTHFTLMQHILKFWWIMCGGGDFFFISYFIATLNKTKSFTWIMFWSVQVEYIQWIQNFFLEMKEIEWIFTDISEKQLYKIWPADHLNQF
jgi:hypothetical protein